ncbi:D-aminoacyl-tRNA deacylase-like [Mya arenaria]|uniref:D-aminoacyl-tRNA deacylase-like n=1 Tax=Mya arenaria TaxID=6604 RepID=UPI0022E61F1F|nr:D-aminoacyl-tRNA deacylase-like [Mya arenaria]
MHGDNGTEAFMLLLRWVKSYLPENQQVYLQCLRGGAYVLRKWSDAFSRLYCRFTLLVSRFNADQIEALRAVPRHRLLLETDAPYFPLEGRDFSSPSILRYTAEAVASLRKENPLDLMRQAAMNADDLFQCPK